MERETRFELATTALATISKGATITGTITHNGQAQTSTDLTQTDINTDALNTQKVTKDQKTGGLNFNTTVDTRVFSKEGREQIKKEQERFDENLKKITDDVASDFELGYDVASDIYKSIQVLKKIEEVRSQLTPEEQEYFDQYLLEFQQNQDPLQLNAAPVAAPAAIGATELTAFVAGVGVAACSATKVCPDAVEEGLKSTQKAARDATNTVIDYTVGIFSKDKKSENKANNAPPQTSQVASTPPPEPPPEQRKPNEPSQNEKKLISTNSEVIAKGSKIRKVNELVQKFGGRAKDWVKKKGRDSSGQEWHWYENNGRKVGWKRVGEHDPF